MASCGIYTGGHKEETRSLHVPYSVLTPPEPEVTPKTADELIDEYFPLRETHDGPQVSPWFSKLMTWIIMLNCAQVGAECQWKRQDSDVLARNYVILDVVFALAFSGEVILKVYKLGPKKYFGGSWNIMDCILTLAMIGDLCSMVIMHGHQPSYIRSIANSFRLARCLRLVRLLRVLKGQPELVVVVEGLLRSSGSLFWVIISLVVIMYLFAVFFVLEVDHEIFIEAGMDADAALCEKDKYFCDLSSAMNSLLAVLVGSEWSGIAQPISQHQSWLMLPFLSFFIISCFGIVNVIIGVIVDATSETRTHIEWQKKREVLRKVSNMWQDKIHKAGLSRESLKGLQGEALDAKKAQRRKEIEYIVQSIIDSGVIDFPVGVRAKTIISLLIRDTSGELTHLDFTVSLGRILLADQPKLMMQSLINQAKETDMVRALRVDVNKRFDKIESKLGQLDRIEATLAQLGHQVVQ